MIRRLTLFYLLNPTAFVDSDFNWDDFDLSRWSAMEYEWEQDGWGGLKDTVSRPQKTIESGRGDCDDYSLVALSYLDATTNHDLYVIVLASSEIPPTGHVVTYDATTERVYSSGEIIDEPFDVYVDESEYDYYLMRNV